MEHNPCNSRLVEATASSLLLKRAGADPNATD